MVSSKDLLFNASTEVTIGDGKKAKFWHNSWLQGAAPRVVAPQLFGLVKRKNKTVEQELLITTGSSPSVGRSQQPRSLKNLFSFRSASIK